MLDNVEDKCFINWYKDLVKAADKEYKIFTSEIAYKTALLMEQITGLTMDNTFYTYNAIEYLCEKLEETYKSIGEIEGILFCDISWHYGRDVNKCIHLMESILIDKFPEVRTFDIKNSLARHTGTRLVFSTAFKDYKNTRYELSYKFYFKPETREFFDFIGLLYELFSDYNIPMFTHLACGEIAYEGCSNYIKCNNQFLIVLSNVEQGKDTLSVLLDGVLKKSYGKDLEKVLKEYHSYKFHVLYSRFVEFLISSSLIKSQDIALVKRHFSGVEESLLLSILNDPIFGNEGEIQQFISSLFQNPNNCGVESLNDLIYKEGLLQYKRLKIMLNTPFVVRNFEFDGFDGIAPLKLGYLVSNKDNVNIIQYIRDGILDCYVLPTSSMEQLEFSQLVTVGYLWQTLKFPLVFIYNSFLTTLYSECRFRRLDKFKVFEFYCKKMGVSDEVFETISTWMKDLDKLDLEAIDWLVSDLGLRSIPEEKQKDVALDRIKLRMSLEDFIKANKEEFGYNGKYDLE